MVPVFHEHRPQVLLPVGAEVLVGVVVGVLVDQPHVAELVHQVHAEPVAGAEQRLGGRVVRHADGVEARVLQEPHASLLRGLIGARAEDAVVVVNAGAAEQRLPAVDEEALRAPLQRPEAEQILRLIDGGAVLHQFRRAAVQTRRIRTPRCDSVRLQSEHRFAVSHGGLCARELLLAVQDRHPDSVAAAHGHRDLGRAVPLRADRESVRRDVRLFALVEVHVPVNAAAGIPAGVGAGGVVRHDDQLVLPAAVERFVQRDEEVGVAVCLTGQLLPVQRDGCVFVHALAFEHDVLLPPVFRGGEALGVNIGAAGEVPAARARGRVFAARFIKHRVVRERDRDGRSLLPALGERPPGVEAAFFHWFSPSRGPAVFLPPVYHPAPALSNPGFLSLFFLQERGRTRIIKARKPRETGT